MDKNIININICRSQIPKRINKKRVQIYSDRLPFKGFIFYLNNKKESFQRKASKFTREVLKNLPTILNLTSFLNILFHTIPDHKTSYIIPHFILCIAHGSANHHANLKKNITAIWTRGISSHLQTQTQLHKEATWKNHKFNFCVKKKNTTRKNISYTCTHSAIATNPSINTFSKQTIKQTRKF